MGAKKFKNPSLLKILARSEKDTYGKLLSPPRMRHNMWNFDILN